MTWLAPPDGSPGLIRPVPAACATADAAQDGKCLSSGQVQAIFKSNGTPLGECRFSERMRMRFAIAAIMKNEASYIHEWVAYYRMLGFEIIIADNGGSDDTSKILSELHDAGVITKIDFLWNGNKPQIPAYRAVLRHALADGIDVVGFLDADEFFTRSFPISSITQKDGRDYLAEVFEDSSISQVSFHWICYGSRSEHQDSRELVLKRFQHHSNSDEYMNVNIKSFIRVKDMFSLWNFLYLGPMVFSAHYMSGHKGKWLIDGRKVRRFDIKKTISHETGYILHYQIKTWDEYCSKVGTNKAGSGKPYSREAFEKNDFNDLRSAVPTNILQELEAAVQQLKNASPMLEPNLQVNFFHSKKLSFGLSSVGGQKRILYRSISALRSLLRLMST